MCYSLYSLREGELEGGQVWKRQRLVSSYRTISIEIEIDQLKERNYWTLSVSIFRSPGPGKNALKEK